MLRFILGFLVLITGLPALADPVLNSAVLPNARVVASGETATIFMTSINSGDMDATNCQVVVSAEIGFRLDPATVDFAWVLTDASGALVGNVNDPFTIAAGGLAQLVLGIDTGGLQLIFHVECDGGFGSPALPAVNGVQISVSDTNPDIIPIVQTFTADGIANFDSGNRLAVISVAAVNNSAAVGTEADVGVNGLYLGFRDGGQFNFFACETDLTGQCIDQLVTCAPNPNFAPPCFTTKLGRDPKTYAFFIILPEGEGVNFFPGVYRFAATFNNQFGTQIASSSVALNAADPVITTPIPRPNGQFEVRVRNTADLNAHTFRQARITITDRALTGRLFRTIDRGAFIQIFRAYFRGEPVFTAPPGTSEKPNQVSRPMSGHTTESTFNLVYYDDGIATNPDGGTIPAVTRIALSNLTVIEVGPTGGTLGWDDVPGRQHPGEDRVFDFKEKTLMQLIGVPDDFLTKASLANTALLWAVSSTPQFGGGNYDIALTPGPDGGIKGATFTEPEGCVIEIVEVGFFDAAGDFQISFLGMSPLSCPTGHKLEPFIGQEGFGNVESTPRFNNPLATEIEMTNIFGDVTDPNGAVLFDTFFLVDPGPPPEKPQVQSSQAKPIGISRYQEIANTQGKPVYLHVDGKDVLVATPEK
jgi:hypothetical protein